MLIHLESEVKPGGESATFAAEEEVLSRMGNVVSHGPSAGYAR